MQCRTCLKIDFENTINSTKLDEFNVQCINLITNLNIQMNDDMPQQLCGNCLNDIKFCTVFREKCISSNTVLVSQKLQRLNEELTSNKIKEEDLERNYEIQNVLKTEMLIAKTEKHNDEVDFCRELLCNEEQFDIYFQNNKDADFHLDSMKSVKIFKKKKAGKTKKNKVIKSGHKISDEDYNNKNYDCGLCPEKLTETKLFEHVNSHEQSNYCDICSKHFPSWPTLLIHRVEHLKGQSFTCHICFKRFRLTLSLQHHYNVKHLNNTVKKILQCSQCNKTYGSVRSLQKHIWALHGSKTFPCNECSLEFPNKRLFDYHRARKHAEKTMLYCDQCDYKNVFSNNLKQHKIRMHVAERVSCVSCGTAMASQAALERHRCASRRPQICPVCGKILDKNARLANHLNTHTDERRYKCDRCPASYKSRAALRVHTDRHNGVRRYNCDQCAQAFYQQSSLIRHRRVHTGEKPYICKVCSKGFTDGYNLKVHMRVHGKDLTKNKKAHDRFEADYTGLQE